MHITRVYTGDDGRSHFEQIELRMGEPMLYGTSTGFHPASGVRLGEGAAGDYELHVAPRRQLVVTLEGEAEIECGDGTKLTIGPGDVFLAEDTTGEGHILRVLGDRRRALVVSLPDDFDLDALRS